MKIVAPSMPHEIEINRPFIAIILSKTTGTHLFSARIIDPALA